MKDRKALVLASNNRHKQQEFAQALGVDVLLPADLGVVFDVEEVERSFIGNALLKAKALYEWVGQPVLADDSGLVILSLPQLLGVQSARFREDLTQSQKNQEILQLMQGIDDRRAYFVCALVLYEAEEQFFSTQQTWWGEVALHASGEEGFGYDPIFLTQDGRCAAQLSRAQKMALSHRGKAIGVLKERVLAFKN